MFAYRVLEFGLDEGLQGQVVDITCMLHHSGSKDQSLDKSLPCFNAVTDDWTMFCCRVLEFGPDAGLQGQVVDIVRMLLDPDSMDQSPEKDPFLELFYEKYIGDLVSLLIEGAEQNRQSSQAELDEFRRQEQVSTAPPPYRPLF